MITKHNLTKTHKNEYSTWKHMKGRCLNNNDKDYKDYGGRGITICEDWKNSPLKFVKDMGNKPGPDYSIERVDHNGNYCPSNCIWIKKTEQPKNTRRTTLILYNNEKLTLGD